MPRRRFITCLIFTIFAFDKPVIAQTVATKTDLAGDPLPEGVVARIGTQRFLPRPYLNRVFFTPDGSTLIGHGGDNVLSFWEAETGKAILEFRDPDFKSFSVDQSQDCTLLALYGHDRHGKPAPDTMLRLYDLATRKPLWSKVNDKIFDYQHHVRFSRDGSRIITGSQTGLRVWDAKSGDELRHEKISVSYGGIDLSPDGKMLAIVSETGLYFWDWEGDLPRKADTGKHRYYNAFRFSADGKTASGYSDYGPSRIHKYDVSSGKFVGGLDEERLRSHAVSPDSKTIAIADYDKEQRRGAVIVRPPQIRKVPADPQQPHHNEQR